MPSLARPASLLIVGCTSALLLACEPPKRDDPSQPEPAAPPVSAESTDEAVPAGKSQSLIDWSDSSQRSRVEHRRGEMSWADGNLAYRLPANTGGHLSIRPPAEGWDLTEFTRIALDLSATEGQEVKLKVQAKNPGANDWSKSALAMIYLDEGQRDTRPVYLLRPRDVREDFPELSVFTGMGGLPGGLAHHWHNVDPAHIKELVIAVTAKPYPQEVRLHAIYAANPVVSEKLSKLGDDFFPFIDSYGQYRHKTWPGKIESDDDLIAGFAEEQTDLERHPSPSSRNKWGGWTGGPQLEATGFFRTQKIDGKWWLIDPDGQLFWSHGVTGVGIGGAQTPTDGRERYFSLPAESDPLASFQSDKGFDFTGANLSRALGENWETEYAELAHRRLASWGMNTLGMWSRKEVAQLRQTPYTVAIHYGYDSFSSKLPDPFSPTFRTNLRSSLESHADAAGDPWCLGFFVNNELHWGKPLEIVGEVFKARPGQPAKIRLVELLKEKHGSVEAFNKAAGTSFADWSAVLASQAAVKVEKFEADAEAFYRLLCETYFQTCREEVKRLAPEQLYLGCRFNKHNEILMEVASEYCDVISYNLYDWSIEARRFPGEDKPFISSEFHFGAQDRGMWGVGLRWASSQQDRARLYRDYVRGALANPNCVGTHWFQYNSQAFTGRGRDGENYQVGMTDIGGRPWPELREAVREVGHHLYEIRTGDSSSPDR